MADMFLDREDAGRQLAARLRSCDLGDAVVLAIPRGGIPVAVEVATRLKLPLDLIIPRKLPIPWNPEAGFGAVTSDGTVVLNESLVREMGMTQEQIDAVVEMISTEIERREQAYRRGLPEPDLEGKSAVIVDDGLASGYTMLTAVTSVRRAGAGRIVVAVPVASESAVRLIRDAVDELICLIESHKLPFAVADYYVKWYDLTDADVFQYLALGNLLG